MRVLKNPLLIIANGDFPKHENAIKQIKKCKSIIACDGGANKLIENGHIPDIIIGDLDSISKTNKVKFFDRIIEIKDQTENDLRKAINYAIKHKINDIRIIGASGNREDHIIGNIFSLLNYKKLNITLFTDTGFFKIIKGKQKEESYKGQKISIFSLDRSIKITSKHLKYNFNCNNLSDLFSGTLNESIGDFFEIELSHGMIIIFQSYK